LLVPLCYLLLEGRKDPSKIGNIYVYIYHSYIYIYIYLYIYVCIYMYICKYIYVYLLYIYIHLYYKYNIHIYNIYICITFICIYTIGLMYLCTFTLLKLSGERSFGVSLNSPYQLSLPVDVPPFTGLNIIIIISKLGNYSEIDNLWSGLIIRITL
jgi:hypothetical protein